jgi:hypothetical protein
MSTLQDIPEQTINVPSRRSSRALWVSLTVAVVGAVAVGALIVNAQPKPLPPLPSSGTFTEGGQTVGETIVVSPQFFPPQHSGVPNAEKAYYTIDSISAVMAQHSALASVDFANCNGVLSLGLEPLSVAMVDCYSWSPAAGSLMSVTPQAYGSSSNIVAVVTPLAKGTIHILGFKVRYHIGNRQGYAPLAGMETLIKVN